MESYRRERGMTDEEWEQFLSLGGQTGYLDLDMQIGTLKLSGERWETWIREAESQIGPKRRIGSCLGVLGGVFLTILLL